MKITQKIIRLICSAFLFLAFICNASATSTKNHPLKSKITDTQIEAFDFQKLFGEAEAYFKAAKSWEKLKCQPKTGFVCNKKECSKKTPTTYVILDKNKETITRCESENCETFAAEFKQIGLFFNVQSEGPIGTLIRVLGDNRYKEITTVGLDAYIANGNCEVMITD